MFNSVKRIAVDLDDVLFDFLGNFFNWHNQTYGTNLVTEDLTQSYLWTAWGGTREQADERVPRFFSEVNMQEKEPLPGAIPVLRELSKGCTLAIVSARDLSAEVATQAWIEKYFSGIFKHVYLGVGSPQSDLTEETKGDVCRRFRADVMIEDQLRHARIVSAVGIPVLLFDNPPDRGQELPQNVQRVQGWADVMRVLG